MSLNSPAKAGLEPKRTSNMTELERLCPEEWVKLPKACRDLPKKTLATIAANDALPRVVNKGSEYLINERFL